MFQTKIIYVNDTKLEPHCTDVNTQQTHTQGLTCNRNNWMTKEKQCLLVFFARWAYTQFHLVYIFYLFFAFSIFLPVSRFLCLFLTLYHFRFVSFVCVLFFFSLIFISLLGSSPFPFAYKFRETRKQYYAASISIRPYSTNTWVTRMVVVNCFQEEALEYERKTKSGMKQIHVLFFLSFSLSLVSLLYSCYYTFVARYRMSTLVWILKNRILFVSEPPTNENE